MRMTRVTIRVKCAISATVKEKYCPQLIGNKPKSAPAATKKADEQVLDRDSSEDDSPDLSDDSLDLE